MTDLKSQLEASLELETLRAALWECREWFEEYATSRFEIAEAVYEAEDGRASSPYSKAAADGQQMVILIDRALVGNHD